MTDTSAEQEPCKTPKIDIDIKTQYIAEQSRPEEKRYVFAYTITLSNQGEASAKLMSRHWIITDANNEIQEVKGVGVVGQQPLLEPGDSYTYTSGVIIGTDTGTMTGSYQMSTPGLDQEFDAEIPVFGLVTPEKLH